MTPTDNQRLLVISKLTPSAQVLYRALDEAIHQSTGKPDALKIIFDLSEQLGGITFYFPLGGVARITQRNIDIFADYESGMSVRELSKKYKLGFNTIFTVIRKFKKS